MTCPGIEEVMAWIDGELPQDRKEAFRAHLADCAECRRLIENQELIEKTWRESYEPPSDFQWRRFEKELTGMLYPETKKSWLRTALPVAAAFAAVLLGVRIFIIGTPPSSVLERIPSAFESVDDTGELLDGDTFRGAEFVDMTGEPCPGEAEDNLQVAAVDSISDLPVSAGGWTGQSESTPETIHSTVEAGEGEEPLEWETARASSTLSSNGQNGAAVVGGTTVPSDGFHNGGDTDALGMILPESAVAGQAGLAEDSVTANRFMHLEGLVDDGIADTRDEEEETSMEEDFAVLVFAADTVGLVVTEMQTSDAASTPPVQQDSVPGALQEAEYYGYGMAISGDTTCDDDQSIAAGSGGGGSGGGAVTSETVSTVAAAEESITEECIEMSLRQDRLRRDNVDSTLQVLENEISADWNMKSGLREVLLPVLVTISFRIAPDGSVFGVEVTVPPDSFFHDFVDEIETRVYALSFEEVPEEDCMNVEMEMVLY